MKKKTSQQEIASPMSESVPPETKRKATRRVWTATDTKKIVYIALMIALAVSIKAANIRFTTKMVLSFVTICYFLAGIFYGPGLAFVIGFLADMIGYLIAPGANPYNPVVGLGYAMIGCITGLCVKFLPLKLTFKIVIGALTSILLITFFYSAWSTNVHYYGYLPTPELYLFNLADRWFAVLVAAGNLIITLPLVYALKRTAFKKPLFTKA